MLFAGVLVTVKANRYGVFYPAFLGLLIKLALCVAGVYYTLPFSGQDAVNFERFAWEWSRGSLGDIVSDIDVGASYLISSITAIFYHFMGRDVSIPIFINGIMGVMIFYLALILERDMWGLSKNSFFFAILVAFHPMLNINSAVILRENYIIIFLVLSSIFLVRYFKSKNNLYILLFLASCLVGTFFHAGVVVFALGLPFYIVLMSRQITVPGKMAVILVVLGGMVGALNYIDFDKFQSFEDGGLSVDVLAEREENRREASTAYLVGMSPNNALDVLWQAPVLSFFLLTKPFPWDVRSGGDLVVFADALLWLFVLLAIWRNWGQIKRNPAAAALLLSLLIAVVAFSYGTGNYGTAFRHRTKFIIMALVIVSPFFPRFKFSK